MLKKELAQLLGVSESIVSRHTKRGMPTDSLERAQRWRKRHLEPGRVKGNRYDPKAKTKAPAPGEPAAAPNQAGRVDVLNQALCAGPVAPTAGVLLDLRSWLRSMPDWRDAHNTLLMPVRVWVALVAYACDDGSMARARAMEQAAQVSAVQMAKAIRPSDTPDGPPCWFAQSLIEFAWDLYELDGRAQPEGEEGD